MADVIYNSFFTDLAENSIDLGADTFKIMLVTSSYTPDVDAHNRKDDVTNEVTGTGYTAGGATLASVTVTQDNTNNLTKWDAADVSWATSTITARGAVIYKSRGGLASADELVKYFDFGTDQVSTGAAFNINFHADGILQIKND
jgi:hypothetical protein